MALVRPVIVTPALLVSTVLIPLEVVNLVTVPKASDVGLTMIPPLVPVSATVSGDPANPV
jgi:hypothetical protein